MIDVLAPEVGTNLRTVLGASLFENSSVLKLMHGCLNSDLEWLIRDFGIKVVNVYDTQEFQKQFVSKKDLSLAKLWERYCEGTAQIKISEKKELQESNWAARPLRQDQLDYAANDTYFLWHIAHAQIAEASTMSVLEAEIETWFT